MSSGQQLGEHNLWEKMSIFEAATRVPLLVRTPWLPQSAGLVSDAVVELVSLYRTLADLAGLTAVEASVQGYSFAGVLRSGGTAESVATPSGGRSASDGPAEPGLGYALSQMTRCAKPTAKLTLAKGYVPCATTPGAASAYTYMG